MKTAIHIALGAILFAGAAFSCRADIMQVRVGTYNIRVSSADVNSTNAWNCRKGELL